MIRVELAIPSKDKNHFPVDGEVVGEILSEVGNKTKGYRSSRQWGFWISDDGQIYQGEALILVTDTSFEIADWFKGMKHMWTLALNQRQLYLAIYVVDWI